MLRPRVASSARRDASTAPGGALRLLHPDSQFSRGALRGPCCPRGWHGRSCFVRTRPRVASIPRRGTLAYFVRGALATSPEFGLDRSRGGSDAEPPIGTSLSRFSPTKPCLSVSNPTPERRNASPAVAVWPSSISSENTTYGVSRWTRQGVGSKSCSLVRPEGRSVHTRPRRTPRANSRGTRPPGPSRV